MKIHTHIMYIVEYDKYLRLLRNQQKLFMVSTKNANYLLVAKPVDATSNFYPDPHIMSQTLLSAHAIIIVET